MCLAVLGLAVASLLAEKTFTGPQGARADAVADAASEFAAPTGSDDLVIDLQGELDQAAALRQTVSIGRLLQEYAQRESLNRQAVPDPFMPGWVGGSDGSPAPRAGSPDSENRATNPDIAAFVRDHRLTAVIGTGRNGGVIINGSLVRMNQTVGGFRLIEVGHRKAKFCNQAGEIVELMLNR